MYNNKMNYWEQLGLDGPTQDIKKIKKAYAKKAHEVNPEDDPEGFVALHNAYKAAIGMARANSRAQEMEESARRTGEPATEPKPAKDPYDFSDLTPASSDDALNSIITFKKENKIETEEQVEKLSRRALIIITRELFRKYSISSMYKRDPGIWNEFWDEPAVKYFERDPEFRKWVVDSTHYPPFKEANMKIADGLNALPEEHKWFEGKDPVIKPKPAKKMNPLLLFVLSSAGLFAMSLALGFLMRYSGMLKKSEPYEVVMIAAGTTLIGIILHFWDEGSKIIKEKLNKKK